MMGGDMDAEKRTELAKQMKEKNEGFDAQIKTMLGDENYAVFETYEKTIPDRTAVSQFKSQIGDSTPLDANQEQLLIAAMSEARKDFKFTTDYNNKTDFSEDMMSKFTEERVDVFFKESDRLNQQYLARAQTILSQEQFTAYQKSLKTQQDMARMGMKMAVQMFKPKQ